MTPPRLALLLLVSAVSGGCRSTPAPRVATPAPAAAATAASLPDSIGWVRQSAEYHAAVIQVYRVATARVEQQASSRTPGTWAVILDADETILSNLQYQIERVGLGYSPESWAAWVRRREAVALPGAAAFLARVRALGGRIAIVTNRLDSECADTVALFKTQALLFDAMLCRPDKGPSDKNPRFEAVAAGKTPAASTPLEVVAFIGDNILDFPGLSQKLRQAGEAGFGEFGVKYFLLPNPMYGSWQESR
jgi:5'-nucleotidase (lipoprotein e(P4) family)